MKIELYIEDPMAGGCGCHSSIKERMVLVNRVRTEAQIWDKVKKSNSGNEFIRTVLSAKVPESNYPVRERKHQRKYQPSPALHR